MPRLRVPKEAEVLCTPRRRPPQKGSLVDSFFVCVMGRCDQLRTLCCTVEGAALPLHARTLSIAHLRARRHARGREHTSRTPRQA